ncbi:MAG: nicotinate-nucleotide adenylyltransferase [Clostridia bacterium]|nr:nicotinate-nucleotide adenylyltransferase [Clostridia bacterium]
MSGEIMKENNCGLRVGICGGTFDPIHNGHLVVAEYIRQEFDLDRVMFIPSGNPPHKDNTKVTDAELRFAMVQDAIQGNPFFEVSRIEIDRKGYTYTVDTLKALREIHGSSYHLFFIVGADVVPDLLSWKNYTEVFALCEFIAVLRPGYSYSSFSDEIRKLGEKYGAVIHTLEAPLVDISSTGVRERVRSGKSIKYLVPDPVEKFIAGKQIYRDGSSYV